MNSIESQMTVYDFNKMAYSQLPSYTEEDKEKATKFIENFLIGKCFFEEFLMLYNKELGYFTLFQFEQNNNELMTKEIMSIIDELGEIKIIQTNETKDGLEFWVKYSADEEIHMFLLFGFTKGVIKV